jgi:carbon storage regulator CsrA
VAVRGARAATERPTRTVVQVSTAGTKVQAFLLAGPVAPDTWSGSGPASNFEQGGPAMLVLSRRSHETVVVGGADGVDRLLTVTVLEIGSGKVRLGFEAPDAVPVHRGEVWERILAARPAPDSADGLSGIGGG